MARSLEIVGERWTLLIVRDLLKGPCKFRDLAASLESVPPGILSQRLKLLEEHDIVARRIYTKRPARAEYILTERGIELRQVVRSLLIWGAKHLPGKRALVHTACDHPIEMAYKCAHCDQILPLNEIEYRTERSTRRRKGRRAASSSGRQRDEAQLERISIES